MRWWSYVVYIVAFETLVLGGCGYAVFVLGHSGWWFVLAVCVSSACFKPERWSSLWSPEIAERYRQQHAKTADE